MVVRIALPVKTKLFLVSKESKTFSGNLYSKKSMDLMKFVMCTLVYPYLSNLDTRVHMRKRTLIYHLGKHRVIYILKANKEHDSYSIINNPLDLDI